MNFTVAQFFILLRFILDVLVVWGLLYSVIKIMRNNSRTIQIVKGILVVFLIKLLAAWLQLTSVNYLIELFLNWGIVVLFIVFQPEIRGMLEKIGKTTSILGQDITNVEKFNMINEIVESVEELSKSKTGALITIQRTHDLQDFIKTGIPMDSIVTHELFGTIFQYGTPLHDGAVIIQGNKIACAAAYFPSTTKDLPSKYGARHRAAVGVSEVTDSITIVVSEETGNISVAMNGRLTQYQPDGLERLLTNLLVGEEKTLQKPSVINYMQNTLGIAPRKKNAKEENTTEKVCTDNRIKPIEVVDLYTNKSGGQNHGK
ncbi:MAG: diadenylate cyclase CdaA [Bacillota bacterium]|nr:diadenylate cyclase CdaA [Bacillota bacterium]